jgi:hypothetical protein
MSLPPADLYEYMRMHDTGTKALMNGKCGLPWCMEQRIEMYCEGHKHLEPKAPEGEWWER